jgi:hypothetical protein
MRFSRFLMGAICACSTIAYIPAHAEGAFMNVECTQVSNAKLHLDCKAGEGTLADLLINYDVRAKDGSAVASGYGSTVMIDESRFKAGEEYNIVVYALVDGNVASQTISRKAASR